MNDSQVHYSIREGDFSDSVIDYSQFVLSNDLYRIEENGSYVIKRYELTDEAGSYFNDAENFFQKKDYANARKNYKKVLELCPTYYKVLVYMGDTYFHERDYVNARVWYTKAIESNYIDYLAHWACANANLYLNDFETALKEISIAKVLNRNNPRLTTKLLEIYKYNKLSYNDWYLEPKYSLSESYDVKEEKDVVNIAYQDYWLPYALVKAVWQYEPNYAESMNNSNFMESKESIASIALTMDKKLVKKHIELKGLQKSLDEGFFAAYVIYEDMLPQNPSIALYLDESDIETIVNYLIKVRSKVK